jgi:hypothetical protein
MNAWGPAGCREHLEEIVDKLQKEGQKRGWTNALLSSIPLASRDGIRAMVITAIHLAEHGEEQCRTPDGIDGIVDEVASVASVVHVLPGWRGTIRKIVEKLVTVSEKEEAKNDSNTSTNATTTTTN